MAVKSYRCEATSGMSVTLKGYGTVAGQQLINISVVAMQTALEADSGRWSEGVAGTGDDEPTGFVTNDA